MPGIKKPAADKKLSTVALRKGVNPHGGKLTLHGYRDIATVLSAAALGPATTQIATSRCAMSGRLGSSSTKFGMTPR
jgi:hypothetical protein